MIKDNKSQEKNYLRSYIDLLDSFIIYFHTQSRILHKEINTIKLAVNYYMDKESTSQEYFELERISDGLRNLNQISIDLEKQFNTKNKDFLYFVDKIKTTSDNTHITILIHIDSKIKIFKDLFDELYFYKQSYYNLIDSKEFSYIPSPKFNKRFRNANLGLYLNKQLNDKGSNSYRSLVSEFYKENKLANPKDIEYFNNVNFFATWSYTTDPYIKKFSSLSNYNEQNIYISMSYVYLDKAILQPIVYHEISHSMKHKKLDFEDKQYLEQSLLPFKDLKFFPREDPIDELYKEILCDLSAVYATGYSYIMSLIHIGFFELQTIFSSEQYFDASEKVKSSEDIIKMNRPKDIVPLGFDFNINNINLAVRLFVLLNLCDKLKINNTYLDGIRYMLNIIFPELDDENSKIISQPTFLSIYKFLSPRIQSYEVSRNLVISLSEKFSFIILKDSLIDSFSKKKSLSTFKKFKEEISSRNTDIKSIFDKNSEQKCHSIYDLLWLCREKKIFKNTPNKKLRITERELNRLYNIYCIYYQNVNLSDENEKETYETIDNIFKSILDNIFNTEKILFKDLEFIKYKSKKGFHPYVEFLEGGFDESRDKCHYVFAPYDIAVFRNVAIGNNLFFTYPFSSNDVVKNNQTLNKFKKVNWYNSDNRTLKLSDFQYQYTEFTKDKGIDYFVDRHSLFLLYEIIKDKPQNNRAYSTIVEIKLANIFSEEENIKLLEFLVNHVDKHKKSFNKCQIFKSLGGEDYILYIEGIAINDTILFGKYIQSQYKKYIIEVEDLILFTYNQQAEEVSDSNFRIISFAKINKKHPKARNFFDYKNKDKTIGDSYLPISSVADSKIPTNRFDFIINWKSEKHIIPTIKKYLKRLYYSQDDESFFSDFNIEVMHKQMKKHSQYSQYPEKRKKALERLRKIKKSQRKG